MSAENEALVRRFFEEFCNGRRAEVADEIIAPDYVSYGPQAPPAIGPDEVKARVGLYQDTLDGHWDVQDVFSVGDRVAVRWIGRGTHHGELMGVAPTGESIAIDAISLFRIAPLVTWPPPVPCSTRRRARAGSTRARSVR